MTERLWALPDALGISPSPELVAFVGGGGKTSLLFALAAALPGRVVVTTTTRIFAAQMRLAPAVVYADDLSRLGELLDTHGRCLVVGRVDGEKARGVPPDLPARLLARPDVDIVLVEADGSRMRPVKAPAAHEPVIPLEATLVVPVVGLDALEGPIDEVAHRPELVRRITNYELRIRNEDRGHVPSSIGRGSEEDQLTPAALARLLTHPEGGLKGVPEGARVVPFLNKVDSAARLDAARTVARLMLVEPRVERVVLGAVQTERPVGEVWRRVTAVVLAAGESRRMGRNKLLLPWGETTVLGQTLDNVRASAVHNVMVVTGHEREQVEAVVRRQSPVFGASSDLAVPSLPAINNADYAKGMLASVQTAIDALPPAIDAILVVLGDQPMVGPETINRLLVAYAATPAGLIAPISGGRRGNPVLIDRRYFAELLALPADAAPRALLARYPDDVLAVPVADDAVLHDLDLPEQYARFRPED